MEYLYLLGRIIFGSFFVIMSMMHFMKSGMLTKYASSKGVSSSKAVVFASGLMILLGGLGVVFNIYINYAALLIVAFLLGVSFKMHPFWKDPKETSSFMKNIALAGAALMLL